MNIKSIINNLKNKGIYLFKDGNDIRYRASKRMMTDDIRNQIKQHKKGILKLLIIENPYNLPVKRPMTKPIQDNLSTNGSMSRLLQGDCLYLLKNIEDDSVDQLVTDPPYGYKFMGKDWDKAVPSVEIWKECFRVLKPGAFAFVMSAPRQDVLNQMITNLSEAGFNTNFTSLYWTFASGFTKAQNISKTIDKKLDAKREVINERTMLDIRGGNYGQGKKKYKEIVIQETIPATPEARQLDGAYAGFQPKPAVEVILVVMKPCKKNYTKQALTNGKGITWLDNCRISYGDSKSPWKYKYKIKWNQGIIREAHEKGRFPANLIVSDDILDDGRKHQGEYSRFFSLDAWAEDLPEKVQQNLPFFIVPKASKKEKNAGLDNMQKKKVNDGRKKENDTAFQRGATLRKNTHPTVKPLTLMSYLITMGSRPGDVVLDPFCGSGTTCIAAYKLQRRSIGIEINPEYIRIAQARLRPLVLESFRQKDTANDFSYEQSESPKKNCGRSQIKKEDYTMLVKRGHGDFPRIYRPYSPNELYGQEEIKQIIINGFKNGTIGHSYLFHGASGTGKTTCARIIGMGLLCEHGPTSMPCGKCQQCKSIMASSNMDFLELNNANFTGIDSMRTLRLDFHYAPFMGRYKIFVFDECHRMTEATQSIMLKEVEDLIDGVYFIFCSTNPEKIIEPLRNRCMSVEFQPVKDKDIRRMLVDVCEWEGIIYQDGALEPIIKEARGLPRNALFLLQKAVDSGKAQKSDNARPYSIRHVLKEGRILVIPPSLVNGGAEFKTAIQEDIAKLSDGSEAPESHILESLPRPTAVLLRMFDGKLNYAATKGVMTDDLRDMIRDNRVGILSLLRGTLDRSKAIAQSELPARESKSDIEKHSAPASNIQKAIKLMDKEIGKDFAGLGGLSDQRDKKHAFRYDGMTGIAESKEFKKKLLADLSCNIGCICEFGCTFCYVPTVTKKLKYVQAVLKKDYKIDEFSLYHNKDNVLNTVKRDLIKIQPGDNREVIFCTTCDPCATEEHLDITTSAIKLIMESSDLHVRVLSKSVLIMDIALALEDFRERITYSLSTGTIRPEISACIEGNASPIEERIKTLNQLQADGFRTYGMLCPILPSEMDKLDILIDEINPKVCEHVWAEAINIRGKSLVETREQLIECGLTEDAEAIGDVKGNKESWRNYSKKLFLNLQAKMKKRELLHKFRFLQYVKHEPTEFKRFFETQEGAVCL